MDKLIDSSSIVYKTVLFSVSFGKLGNSRQVSKDVLLTDANHDYLSVNKKLLDSPELEAIISRDAQMYNYVKSLCYKYEDGLLLLPREYMVEVDGRLETYKIERAGLVEAFMKAYVERIEQARTALGSQFDDKQYPGLEEAKAKFHFSWCFRDFAVPEALKMVGLYDKEQEKVSAKLAIVADEITLLMRQQVLDLVNKLKTSLEPTEDGKNKRFYASTVTNIQDFVSAFKAKNVTNDIELEEVMNSLATVISSVDDVSSLKKDDGFKTTLLGSMDKISEQLETLVETVPTRKFKSLDI